MIRVSTIASAAVVLSLATGCDKGGAGDQQNANAAQAEANKKIAEANKEAVTETTNAQVKADKKIAAAESDFAKRREDYRHDVQSSLVDVDKKVDTLAAKSSAATGKAKTDMDMRLTQIRAARASLNSDLEAIESSNAMQWDATKARVDKDLSNLKSMVDKVD